MIKRIPTLSFALLSCCCIATTGVASGVDAIVISTGDNYPPVTSTKLPDGGMATKIVTRAFALSGMPIQLLWQPWARGYKLTLNGAIDAAFPWGPNEQRVNQFYFSIPLLHMTNYAYVNVNTDIKIKSPEDLKNKRYCNPNGYGDFGIVRDYKRRGLMKREDPIDMVQCFKMLASKRVDLVIAPEWDADYGITHSGVDRKLFKQEQLEVAKTPLSLIVSKEHAQGKIIIDHLNEGINILKKTGEFDKIYNEFGFQRYDGPEE